MARTIQNFPNVTTPAVPYPNGRIKDEVPGVSDGTPVNEFVYGDIHQFFAWLMDVANVTPDGNPDSSTNNFQFIDALAKATIGVWEDASSLLVNGWSVVSGSVFEIRICGSSNLDQRFGDVEFRGAIENANVAANAIFAELPVGFFPTFEQLFITHGGLGAAFAPQQVIIATNGDVSLNLNAPDLISNGEPLFMNGVKFGRFAAP